MIDNNISYPIPLGKERMARLYLPADLSPQEGKKLRKVIQSLIIFKTHGLLPEGNK